MALVVKNPPASARDIRDVSSVLGSGRSPGGGHGNPLQYSCLENPMNRGVWWALVHKVAQSWTLLKWLSTHGTHINKSSLRSSVIFKSEKESWDLKKIFFISALLQVTVMFSGVLRSIRNILGNYPKVTEELGGQEMGKSFFEARVNCF